MKITKILQIVKKKNFKNNNKGNPKKGKKCYTRGCRYLINEDYYNRLPEALKPTAVCLTCFKNKRKNQHKRFEYPTKNNNYKNNNVKARVAKSENKENGKNEEQPEPEDNEYNKVSQYSQYLIDNHKSNKKKLVRNNNVRVTIKKDNNKERVHNKEAIEVKNIDREWFVNDIPYKLHYKGNMHSCTLHCA